MEGDRLTPSSITYSKNEKILLANGDDMEEEEEKISRIVRMTGMDHLLSVMGHPGRYQILIFLALSSCMFPVVFNDLSTIFYTLHPTSSRCSLQLEPKMDNFLNTSNISHYSEESGKNLTVPSISIVYGDSQMENCYPLDQLEEKSSEAVFCQQTMRHEFAEDGVWSIVSEWNLICREYWQVSFATTVYFLGVMTGSMTLGHLADRWGRYRCIIVCYLGYIPLGIALSFVEQYWLFLVLRFCIGFFIQGVQSVCFVLVMEYCSPKYRDVVGGLEGLVGGLAVGALSGIAYWWKNWRYIQLAITLPSLIALFKAFFLRESLRWQMVQGRIDEAKETVLFILRWNRLAPETEPSLDEQLKVMSDALAMEQELEASYTWLDCFRTPRMRKYTLAQSFIWFTVLFVYYGISFSINDLSGDIYINLIAGSAAEIPVYVLTVYFMHRFGRKKPLLVYFGGCGILCLLVAAMSGDYGDGWSQLAVIRTVTVFAARFTLAGTYAVVFVYGSELFPTVLRNTAFGICICCHTAGGVVAPQVLLLGKVLHEAVPFVIFGMCCLGSCLLLLTLPETLHRRMPDTIKQVEGSRH